MRAALLLGVFLAACEPSLPATGGNDAGERLVVTNRSEHYNLTCIVDGRPVTLKAGEHQSIAVAWGKGEDMPCSYIDDATLDLASK